MSTIGEQFLKQRPLIAEGNPHLLDIQNIADLVFQDIGKSKYESSVMQTYTELLCLPPWNLTLSFFAFKRSWAERNGVDVEMAAVCQLDKDRERITIDHYTMNSRSRFDHVVWMEIPLRKGGLLSDYAKYGINRDAFGNPAVDDFVVALNVAYPSLAAFAFCHCANVQIEKVSTPRNARRRAERKGEKIFEHHVLHINKMRQVLEKQGGMHEHGGGILKAMHVCRGHFGRYGEKYGTGKLFGKLEGQFWIPQHIRGSINAGVVTTEHAIGK